jgi:hypothetical protein
MNLISYFLGGGESLCPHIEFSNRLFVTQCTPDLTPVPFKLELERTQNGISNCLMRRIEKPGSNKINYQAVLGS